MASQWLVPISSCRWHSSPFWWACVTEEATHIRDPGSKDRCKKQTSFQHPPLRAHLKDLIPQRFHHFPIPLQPRDQRFYTGTVGAHFRSPLDQTSKASSILVAASYRMAGVYACGCRLWNGLF